MKKLLYVAIMALTVGLMASCAGKSGSSDYYKNGKTPDINVNENTVNGVKYDNTNEKCWKFTINTTTMGITVGADEYTWATEFVMVAACEESMYLIAQSGVSKASYSYVEAPSYKDSEACLENNEKEK